MSEYFEIGALELAGASATARAGGSGEAGDMAQCMVSGTGLGRLGLGQATARVLDNSVTIHLEQMYHRLPYDCHFNTRTGFAYRRRNPDGTSTYTHAYCNMMTCRTCARRRCVTAVNSIKAAVTGLGLGTHVTLTLAAGVKDHEQGRKLARANRRLLINISRKTGGRFSYVWAFGGGSREALHLHMLMNVGFVKAASAAAKTGSASGQGTGLSRKWLRQTWHGLTGALQVKVTEFHGGDADNLARYLMKNVMETVLGGCVLSRRFASSRDIRLIDRAVPDPKLDPDGAKWERVRGPSAYHGRVLKADGAHDVLNSTFIVPKPSETPPVGDSSPEGPPPCLGTGEDGTKAQGGGQDRSGPMEA